MNFPKIAKGIINMTKTIQVKYISILGNSVIGLLEDNRTIRTSKVLGYRKSKNGLEIMTRNSVYNFQIQDEYISNEFMNELYQIFKVA